MIFQWLLTLLLHKWKRKVQISDTNLSIANLSKKKLPTVQLNAPVVIRARVTTKIAMHSYG